MAARGLRALAWLVIVGVVIQSSALVSMRITNRAHIHVAAAMTMPKMEHDDDIEQAGGSSEELQAEHGSMPVQQSHHIAPDTDHTHAALHQHAHRHAETHEHSHVANDVVYLHADESALIVANWFSRIAHDLDGLLQDSSASLIALPDRTLFAALAVNFRSRMSPPLERPPRTGAFL